MIRDWVSLGKFEWIDVLSYKGLSQFWKNERVHVNIHSVVPQTSKFEGAKGARENCRGAKKSKKVCANHTKIWHFEIFCQTKDIFDYQVGPSSYWGKIEVKICDAIYCNHSYIHNWAQTWGIALCKRKYARYSTLPYPSPESIFGNLARETTWHGSTLCRVPPLNQTNCTNHFSWM